MLISVCSIAAVKLSMRFLSRACRPVQLFIPAYAAAAVEISTAFPSTTAAAQPARWNCNWNSRRYCNRYRKQLPRACLPCGLKAAKFGDAARVSSGVQPDSSSGR